MNSGLRFVVVALFLLSILYPELAVVLCATTPHYYFLDLIEGTGPKYDGHGGLSAGGTSRLLIDYPEKQRNEILNFLFLPNHGASIGLLKIEIGGDAQSTVGTEASHMHSNDDDDRVDCTAGYEGWLAKEAKARNPKIQIWSLSWGVPGWLGTGGEGYYSKLNIDYQVSWLECLRDTYGVESNYLGLWNEEAQGSVDYVLALRKALDERGFEDVGITVEATWQPLIRDNILHNATFNSSVAAATLHYPCNTTCDEALQARKKLWVGEDTPTTFQNWTAASCWGRKLNQHYLKLGATSVTAWALVWSVLRGLAGPQTGTTHQFRGTAFLLAEEPWSGHYEVLPTLWIMAHWGQFVQPGWRFLQSGRGSEFLPLGGSVVTLVSPPISRDSNVKQSSFTMIVETLQGSCETNCNVPTFNSTQHLSFRLPSEANFVTSLSLWCSNQTHIFIQQPSIQVYNQSFSLAVSPDTICTITSLRSKGHKGQRRNPALPSQPFPRKLVLSTRGLDNSLVSYVSDVYGSFAIRNNALTQLATSKPIGWAAMNLDPLTLMGDEWETVKVEIEVSFGIEESQSSSDTIRVCGVCRNVGYRRIQFACSCCLELQRTGLWKIDSGSTTINGTIPLPNSSPWHSVRLEIADGGVRSVKVDSNLLLVLPRRYKRTMIGQNASGMVGFGCSSYFPCSFRNISLDATTELIVAQ